MTRRRTARARKTTRTRYRISKIGKCSFRDTPLRVSTVSGRVLYLHGSIARGFARRTDETDTRRTGVGPGETQNEVGRTRVPYTRFCGEPPRVIGLGALESVYLKRQPSSDRVIVDQVFKVRLNECVCFLEIFTILFLKQKLKNDFHRLHFYLKCLFFFSFVNPSLSGIKFKTIFGDSYCNSISRGIPIAPYK